MGFYVKVIGSTGSHPGDATAIQIALNQLKTENNLADRQVTSFVIVTPNGGVNWYVGIHAVETGQ